MTGWNTDTKGFAKAVADFEAALPGFWWRVGQCSVGAHASCAVDGKGCQAELLDGVKTGDTLDLGFHCDTQGGAPSEALRDVMQQALKFLIRTRKCARRCAANVSVALPNLRTNVMTASKKYRRPEAWEVWERVETLRKNMEEHGIARGIEFFNDEEEAEQRLPPATPEEFRYALAELVLMELKQNGMGSAEEFLKILRYAVDVERDLNGPGVRLRLTKKR